jgi:CRP-like cAMP-binding protein
MAGINISEEFFKKFGKRFPAEAYLCKEGEPGSSMYMIHSGKVAIIKNTPAGEKVLAILGPGDFFGEMALMGLQDRRAASAKTAAETMVLELNRDAFEGLIRRSPEIAIQVIKTLTERIRDSNGKLSALIHKDDRIRLSTYLTYVVNEKGLPAPNEKPGRCAVFKAKDISSALSIDIEKVNQFIGFARKARLLGQNGDWVWVPYPSYLKPFADFLVANSK